MYEEKHMAGDYGIIHAVHIGDTEIVVYRKALCQIALRNESFCASPNSRGSACHCINLYTGKSTRYERSDVSDILEGNQIPKWAHQGLKRHQQEQQNNKTQRSTDR